MFESSGSDFGDAKCKDGRASLRELYEPYEELADNPAWEQSLVGEQRVLSEEGEVLGYLPIFSLRTQLKGRAMWVIAGIHGEEPAGPMAVSSNIRYFEALRQAGIPVVLLPMCNPAGYFRDWRYMNARRGNGASIGDSDHVLPNSDRSGPRLPNAAIAESAMLIDHVLKLSMGGWEPKIALDLHEDEDDNVCPRNVHPYIYVLSRRGRNDPVGRRVVQILGENGMPMSRNGHTRFGEKIHDGLVANKVDGSVDELLYRGWVYVDGVWRRKKVANSVVTVETPTLNVPLEARVKAHSRVLAAMPDFWKM